MENHVVIYQTKKTSIRTLEMCIQDFTRRNKIDNTWYLYKTENGKPIILNNDFYYSKTITEAFSSYAFSLHPISIDIQKFDEHVNYQKISDRFYHPQEIEYVKKHGIRSFYKIWCLKECYIKFFDLRIEKDFPQFSVLEILDNNMRNLTCTLLPLSNEYFGSLLTEAPTTFEFISIEMKD
ncbi:4'-phosphopantetheinyl transferase superfamily protein [Erysipelothrix amsterdamensis]|uniref:4'-phosphopantetheinyl transferase superfamily protein n=1 Tax=Erysipelothrix amsterdamensis TaxID=2929157 RepID=A0AAU9VI12_9FIRM|nr:4'-phosphopantetheinyl transferase superfamily protein [Erysipelothrix sp. A18Y020d]CAH2761099.1 4'-phosphopantetheinyl transferase superfamily protein [Erysipelothrix sp. A18Y020d]